jgi:hypothetical protein
VPVVGARGRDHLVDGVVPGRWCCSSVTRRHRMAETKSRRPDTAGPDRSVPTDPVARSNSPCADQQPSGPRRPRAVQQPAHAAATSAPLTAKTPHAGQHRSGATGVSEGIGAANVKLVNESRLLRRRVSKWRVCEETANIPSESIQTHLRHELEITALVVSGRVDARHRASP